jgi:hypothetical protein
MVDFPALRAGDVLWDNIRAAPGLAAFCPLSKGGQVYVNAPYLAPEVMSAGGAVEVGSKRFFRTREVKHGFQSYHLLPLSNSFNSYFTLTAQKSGSRWNGFWR